MNGWAGLRARWRSLLAPALVAVGRLRDVVRPPPPAAVRLLIFHDVPDEQREAFARLIDHLGRRYGFIDPDTAARRLLHGAPADGRTPVLLTFDDGFISNRQVAEAVLQPRGVRALFFVCPGLIELAPEKQRSAIAANVFRGHVTADELPTDMALMNWADLAALERQGHRIGCHGFDHNRLAGLEEGRLDCQVVQAKALLEARMGTATPWFAFTFGDVASIDAAALAHIGRHFPLCRSGVRGLARHDHPPLAIPADSLDLSTPWPWQLAAAEGALWPLYRTPRAALARLASCIPAQAG